jgi:hypothetical protein
MTVLLVVLVMTSSVAVPVPILLLIKKVIIKLMVVGVAIKLPQA